MSAKPRSKGAAGLLCGCRDELRETSVSMLCSAMGGACSPGAQVSPESLRSDPVPASGAYG